LEDGWTQRVCGPKFPSGAQRQSPFEGLGLVTHAPPSTLFAFMKTTRPTIAEVGWIRSDVATGAHPITSTSVRPTMGLEVCKDTKF